MLTKLFGGSCVLVVFMHPAFGAGNCGHYYLRSTALLRLKQMGSLVSWFQAGLRTPRRIHLSALMDSCCGRLDRHRRAGLGFRPAVKVIRSDHRQKR